MTAPHCIDGDSPDLYLEVTNRSKIWEQSQQIITPGGQWRAYLNGLALCALRSWLSKADYLAQPWPNSAALASFWSVVNGCVLDLGGSTRLVLIPDEAMDQAELRVPQEWVDIPSWAGDYYLALHVNLEEGTVCFWGFTSHARLKHHGQYDAAQRSYGLMAEDLFDSLLLGVSLLGVLTESLRAPLPELPALGVEQAHNLLNRLGSSSTVTFPRLAVPFVMWGALLEHAGWRQNLYERRQGLSEHSVLAWLREGIGQWGWTYLTTTALQGRTLDADNSPVMLSKLLQIAGQPYELRVQQQDIRVWRFQLQSTLVGGLIPRGFVLRLLTEDRQPFVNNETMAITAIEYLVLDVEVDVGEGLVWETEPIAEGYDPEILYFD